MAAGRAQPPAPLGERGDQQHGQRHGAAGTGGSPGRRHGTGRQQHPAGEDQADAEAGHVHAAAQPLPGGEPGAAGQPEQCDRVQRGGHRQAGQRDRQPVRGLAQRQHRDGEPGGQHGGVEDPGDPAKSSVESITTVFRPAFSV
ncbi:hypothetical protein ABZ591_25235 [Micromonospora fulviviridis]|uniref:hypothetical protein n=1 Tax=Micromonospora fulviviridis TaxID=47860 RepID=UPI0033C19639